MNQSGTLLACQSCLTLDHPFVGNLEYTGGGEGNFGSRIGFKCHFWVYEFVGRPEHRLFKW